MFKNMSDVCIHKPQLFCIYTVKTWAAYLMNTKVTVCTEISKYQRWIVTNCVAKMRQVSYVLRMSLTYTLVDKQHQIWGASFKIIVINRTVFPFHQIFN